LHRIFAGRRYLCKLNKFPVRGGFIVVSRKHWSTGLKRVRGGWLDVLQAIHGS